MKLEEMLAYTAGVHLDDRTDLLDGDPDSIWSDETLVRFFNAAQDILCRRAWVIIETGVAPAGVITLVTSKVLYPLHKSVLRVFDATPTTQSAPLGHTSDAALRDPSHPGLDAFDRGVAASAAGSTTVTPGTPLAVATDAGTRMLRVYPPPAAAQTGLKLSLKVARLPVCYLSVDKIDGSPEVPDEYHLALCDYAAARCLTLANVDGQGKTDGRLLLEQFNMLVKEARQDRQRAEMHSDNFAFASTTARA